MAPHPEITKIISSNQQWADEARAADAEFFVKQTLPSQKPDYLWIGCSDSRVVEALITGFGPGVIFTQRNIANQFNLEDFNAQSVLAYAVDVLKVPHIYVVGHTDCGGVRASLTAASAANFDPTARPVVTLSSYPADAPINRWLEPLTLLAHAERCKEGNGCDSLEHLLEANVRQQMSNLCRSDTVANAWARRQDLTISGFVYDIALGRLRPVAIMEHDHSLPTPY